jgi:hypothetical protein
MQYFIHFLKFIAGFAVILVAALVVIRLVS